MPQSYREVPLIAAERLADLLLKQDRLLKELDKAELYSKKADFIGAAVSSIMSEIHLMYSGG